MSNALKSNSDDRVSFLSHDEAKAAGFHSRRNETSLPQMQATADHGRKHGYEARVDRAKERDEARKNRSINDQLALIKTRRGASRKEVERLMAQKSKMKRD